MLIRDNVLVKVTNFDIKDGTFIIPESVTIIGVSIFENCENLREINIPNSVKEIGDWAFCGCKNLSKINMSEGVTIIGNSAFTNCENLREITIPNSVKKIGNRAFYNCKNLREFTISNNVKKIGNFVFTNCENLREITISNSVKEIGTYAFCDCSNLNINIKTSLFYARPGIFRSFNITGVVNELKIYNIKVDLNNQKDSLRKIRVEELYDKIKEELFNNKIKNKKCFKISEHKEFIDRIINNFEIIENYDYRMDFDNYINDYINKHREISVEDIEPILKEIQNCEPNYNELKKYPYIISTLLLNIKISYSKNEETIKLKKVLSKLTKIELNNPSDFIKLVLKVFFDSDEGVIINKISVNKLTNYSKKQIKILEEQNKTYETLKKIIRVYLKKEKECEINLSEDLNNLELSREEEYLNYEQITNEICYNFSCIMQLKKITSVIIPELLNYYSLNKVILKRKEEIEILNDILNELNNIIETKENRLKEKDILVSIEENKNKLYIK